MGLTVHYTLKAPEKWTFDQAVAKLAEIREFALSLKLKEVTKMMDLAKLPAKPKKGSWGWLFKLGLERIVTSPWRPGSYFSQMPSRAVGFFVWPADGSEAMPIVIADYDPHLIPAATPENKDTWPRWGCAVPRKNRRGKSCYPKSWFYVQQFMKKWKFCRYSGDFRESGGGWYGSRPTAVDHELNVCVGSASANVFRCRSSWRQHRDRLAVRLGALPFSRMDYPAVWLVSRMTVDEFMQFMPTVKGTAFREDIATLGLGVDHVEEAARGVSRGFCKTHYAVNKSLDNFLVAHLGVISVLDHLKSKGFKVTVSDEGSYWKSRDVSLLCTEIGQQSAMIAAFIGSFTDALENAGHGRLTLQAPIKQNAAYEQLEAKGQALMTANAADLVRAITSRNKV